MCGLIGLATKMGSGFTHQETEVVEELLFMDTVRGPDSTGACAVFNDGSVQVAKKATWAPAFIVSKAFSEMRKLVQNKGKIVMGHNRKATVGNIVSANAHPFIVQNELVLMHNGSLTTHKHLAETEVDSEAIAQYIHDKWTADVSNEEKSEILAHIGGAWALVWYDLRTEKLNIVRNHQRPLSYMWYGGTLVWASEEDMLKLVVKRNNLGTHADIKNLPAYTLLTFDGQELQEVALPQAPFYPKPATTIVHQRSDTGYNNGKVCASPPHGGMSKSQFKKFLKAVVGKRVQISVEDFVDVHGKTQWYGENTQWKFPHEMIGYTDEETMMFVLSNYSWAMGTVLGGSYNKATGSAQFHVKLEKSENAAAVCH